MHKVMYFELRFCNESTSNLLFYYDC